MSYPLTMLSSQEVRQIERFIKHKDNSHMYEPIAGNSTKADILANVRSAESGSFCFYACEGFNEYAFYKSEETIIYSLTFHSTKLSKYFKI